MLVQSQSALDSRPSTANREKPSFNLAGAETLTFNRQEQEILDEFELWINRLVSSFDGFRRPEFSKVK